MNLRRLLIGTAIAFIPLITFAQTIKGPVKLIVGYPAGGSLDAVARLLSDRLREELGTTVIVENKPGAGGQIAADFVRAASGDGTTVLVANSHMMVMLPLTSKTIKYNARKDFKAIGRISTFYEAVAVPTSSPITTVSQWMDQARGNAKLANYGVPAPGSVSHFAGYKLGVDAKTQLDVIPYKGAAPLVQDLLGGQVAAGILPVLDVAVLHLTGKVRVLAVNGSKRAQLLPGVPTLKELGLSGFDSLEWSALLLPESAPKALVDQFNTALNKVLAQKDLQERLLKLGMEANPSTPEELSALIAADMNLWGPMVKASGFTVD